MNLKHEIVQLANEAITGHTFPGCVVGVVWRSGERLVIPCGRHTYESDSQAATADTIYDTASITKSIPTNCLALQLIDEGRLSIDDQLITYLPDFANSDRERVRIKHLLTYTLDGYGFTSAAAAKTGKSLPELTGTDLKDVLLTHDFASPPGTIFKYTNIPTALLGLVIERLTGVTLDTLAQERFFTPLDMMRTTFHPEQFAKEDIVPTEHDDWRDLVHGVVHDESAHIFKQAGQVVGHAGLFSTAPDLLTFLEVLLHEGTFGGRQYFSRDAITLMQTNQIPELRDHTALGWELYQPRYMGDHATTHTFGKTGFTGTLVVCDIAKGVAYVILSNRTYPTRPADSTAINAFRKQIGEIILGG